MLVDFTLRKVENSNVFQPFFGSLSLIVREKRHLNRCSHSPLHGILGMVHLLKLSTDLSAEQLEYLGLIESAALKMNNLIVRLLDLNRIANADSQVKKENINLVPFLNRLNQSFSEVAKKKSITLIMENETDALEIHTDASLLEQIIDNLISNAIKFSPFHKKVWVRAKQSATNHFIFEVEDQGPGISADEIPKLFRSFQRLSAQPTGNESSTGLGLSIVKEMANKINASISVTSNVGSGSIFRVVLN